MPKTNEDDIRKIVLKRSVAKHFNSHAMDVMLSELKGIFTVASAVHQFFRPFNDTRNLASFINSMDVILKAHDIRMDQTSEENDNLELARRWIQLLESKVNLFVSLALGPEPLVRVMTSLDIGILNEFEGGVVECSHTPTQYGLEPNMNSLSDFTSPSTACTPSPTNSSAEGSKAAQPTIEMESTFSNEIIELPSPMSSLDIHNPAPTPNSSIQAVTSIEQSPVSSIDLVNPAPTPVSAASSTPSMVPLTDTPFQNLNHRPNEFSPYGSGSGDVE